MNWTNIFTASSAETNVARMATPRTTGRNVRGTHGTTELAGRALRLLQTGNLQTYALLFALGVALVLYLVLK